MASVPLLGVLSRLERTTSISVGERHSLLRSVKRLEDVVSTEMRGDEGAMVGLVGSWKMPEDAQSADSSFMVQSQ